MMLWFARNFEFLISAAAFTLMLVTISANVLCRYFFSYALPFAEELAYLGFDYAVFFGASLLYREHGLIAVTVFVDRLSQGIRHYVLLFNFLVLTLANAYLCYLGWILSQGSWVRRSAYIEYPYFFINIAPTIAFGLMAIYSARFFLKTLFGGVGEDAGISEAESPDAT
ncbi:TRAP transporter small permease [Roseovarius sp.]|uniref:TRAP transporter small permease n=1 Tax=Roseovarius sp. TaxID=1486281 RepID=UPI00263317EB|nr:TRAP transporter small permease [Roseovarius sp.]MDM8166658.1 TRAP transporter small permease [Roseovarius sp.]